MKKSKLKSKVVRKYLRKPNKIKIVKFGVNTPNKLTEDTLHKIKVMDRKKQIAFQKLDNEIEEFFKQPKPIVEYPYTLKPPQISFWKRIINFFNQFKP